MSGPLTVGELEAALLVLLKRCQSQAFESELKTLKKSKLLRSGKLYTLSPFLDEHNLIRVGGRLSHSELPVECKHPIVLPARHPLTNLLIMHEHHRNLHAGPQAMLSSLRQNYWPLSGRQMIRSVLRKCITCFRVKPTALAPPMGQLPSSRVKPSRVFSNTGVDYAGPFLVKDGKTRNRKIVKAYACIFVCFATKAVHLELVSDLSSNSFLNCLKRFVSRRGLCTDIYSDNATNFVGANNQLKQIAELAHDESVQFYVTKNKIRWHFIPSRSPHFGGLWEAAVKSAKYHLNRMTKGLTLTFEELYTLLTQIEAVLNSRPLSQISEDPADLEPLTPGHFLIGAPLMALPQQCHDSGTPVNRLSRFAHLQVLAQHFWNRWSRDYLHHLQQKHGNGNVSTQQIHPGTLVVLKEDNSPPLNWPMGRVTAVHPGPDGVVRVVTVKTRNTTVKRAVTRVCPLPVGI